MSSDIVLDVQDVRQSFKTGFWMKEVQILKGISVQAKRNTVLGLLGPNGAGKTTLISLIVGIRRPTSGLVKVFGHDATLSEAKRKIGYLPERPYFPVHLTGVELLKYLGHLSDMDPSTLNSRIDEVLELVGMTHARKRELSKYSKGMLQRIGVAQAILHDPEILIFDEPMSGLDPVGRAEMRGLIHRLAQDGKTVFFSSHVIPDVEAICEEVVVIKNGIVAGQGTVRELVGSGTGEIEIAFECPDEAQANSIGSQFGEIYKIPEGFGVTVNNEETANQFVEQLVREKNRILWMTPHRPSLEKFFEKDQAA